MKKRRTNRIRTFYYAHPYLVIFNILIIYNIAIILLFSLLLAYLQYGYIGGHEYVEAIQYCAIYTMNSGDIWKEAPTKVVVLKIIINTTQMITFSGALIGLATSMLQGLFNRRVHNLGKLKLKNHFVILNWSPIGANIIKELSFIPGRKVIVILADVNRDIIQEEIDNLFLESNLDKKDIKIFVKTGSPSSRKALKEVSIEKCYSIALLSKSKWNTYNGLNDADSFKALMAILSLNKNANVVVEANDKNISDEINDLMGASSELRKANISIFSRNNIVGNALGRSAINTSFADLFSYLLSFEDGTFYSESNDLKIEDALKQYNKAIPIVRYNENDGEKLYFYSQSYSNVRKSLTKKEPSKTIQFEKNIENNSFTLYVIGDNDRSESILDVCNTHNLKNEGKIDCKIYPIDYDIDLLITEINGNSGRKKILILSDENVNDDELDNNVFLTIIKLKTSTELSKNVEIYAEIFDPQSKFSLESLNVDGMIISNEMVSLYIAQLLTHPEAHKFYEDLLVKNSDNDLLVDFDVRLASELIKFENEITFDSKLEFINSVYKASNNEYLPIGFVGREEKKNLLTNVQNLAQSALDVKDKLVNSVQSALTLTDVKTDSHIAKSNIEIMDINLRRQEKI
nr:NAD-binding protein [Acholeplasmatales bacterium]